MSPQNKFRLANLFIFIWFLAIWSCTVPNGPQAGLLHPEWSRQSVIYEINIRQFTPEGTFKALEAHLPRLQALGVDILWLMPLHPIGEQNRKGTLGSYYSVKDYRAINPEFGTAGDFRQLVNTAHQLGLKVIIDWVPNHSAWDNALTTEHPEYYLKDSAGRFVSPFDWTDVIRFDYGNPGLRRYMVEAMKWWLTEYDIDGYRCDVAHMVPVSFWDTLRPELDKVKPVFMLAEADQPELHRQAFDMSYDWKGHHIMNEIAKGNKPAGALVVHFQWVDTAYPDDSYLMQFTSNHDENSWNGTEFERMGEGAGAFAALAATIPDMLLIYNGQESAFNRRLLFFEKDSIDWGNYPLTGFYQKLIQLKTAHKSLWNGSAGARPVWISTVSDSAMVVFVRCNGNDTIAGVFNISDNARAYTVKDSLLTGDFIDWFSDEAVTITLADTLMMAPWGYQILVK